MLINKMFALADGTCVLINEMFALVDGTCVLIDEMFALSDGTCVLINEMFLTTLVALIRAGIRCHENDEYIVLSIVLFIEWR